MSSLLSEIVITNIYTCNYLNVIKDKHYRRKDREHFALICKITGKTIYKTESGTLISDNKHICLLSKGSNYSFVNVEAGECLTIEFQANLPEPIQDIISFPINNSDEIVKQFRAIEHLMTFRNENYKIECMSKLYKILDLILKQNKKDYVDSDKKALLKPALKYIEEHLSQGNISNETLAQICGISCVYFRKLFTQVYHTSPNAYINHLRIQKSEGLLIGDYESISKVAETCGFSNVYYFSKVFKRSTGFTPTQYARTKISTP